MCSLEQERPENDTRNFVVLRSAQRLPHIGTEQRRGQIGELQTAAHVERSRSRLRFYPWKIVAQNEFDSRHFALIRG
jgi:hypothetical protein